MLTASFSYDGEINTLMLYVITQIAILDMINIGLKYVLR